MASARCWTAFLAITAVGCGAQLRPCAPQPPVGDAATLQAVLLAWGRHTCRGALDLEGKAYVLQSYIAIPEGSDWTIRVPGSGHATLSFEPSTPSAPARPLFYIKGASLTLQGLVFLGAPGRPPMIRSHDSSLRLLSCRLTGFYPTAATALVHSTGGSVDIAHSSFSNNVLSAPDSALLRVDGPASALLALSVSDSSFLANEITGAGAALVTVRGGGTDSLIHLHALEMADTRLGPCARPTAALSLDTPGEVVLEASVLSHDFATGPACALVASTSAPHLRDCTFAGLVLANGSRAISTPVRAHLSSVSVLASVFRQGAGLLSSEAVIHGSRLAANRVEQGAFLLRLSGASHLSATVIANNTVHGRGDLVSVEGAVEASGLRVSRNAAPGGHVLYLEEAASLRVTGSDFVGNTASSGGALFVSPAASASVHASSFANNTALGPGAAIRALAGSHLDLTGSDFSANRGLGGGALGLANGTSLRVEACSFEGDGLLPPHTAGSCREGQCPVDKAPSLLALRLRAVDCVISSVSALAAVVIIGSLLSARLQWTPKGKAGASATMTKTKRALAAVKAKAAALYCKIE
jgi:hypothetical protein